MANFRESVMVTFPDGRVGEGYINGAIALELSPGGGGLKVPRQPFTGNMDDIRFHPEPVDEAIYGSCGLRVNRWNLERETTTILSKTSNGLYAGTITFEDVPDGLRAIYEKPPQVTLEGNRPGATGDIGIPTPELELKPYPLNVLSGGASTTEIAAQFEAAVGHVQEIRGFIRDYLMTEPDEFRRAVLEALRADVNSLYDEMNGVVKSQKPVEASKVRELLLHIRRFANIARGVKDVAQLAGYADDLIEAARSVFGL